MDRLKTYNNIHAVDQVLSMYLDDGETSRVILKLSVT